MLSENVHNGTKGEKKHLIYIKIMLFLLKILQLYSEILVCVTTVI